MTLPPANGRDGISWEREREVEHYNSAERGGGGDKSITNGSTLVSQIRKRPRANSGVDEGRRLSPTARGGGLLQDKLDPSNGAVGHPTKEE
jgi:MADS-box transcription factor